jgi:hypothetical protein
MCEGRRDGETKMNVSCRGGWIWCCLALVVLGMATVRSQAGAPQLPACEKVVLQGEVNAGQEWKAAFGQGWVFRVLPIASGKAGYSGWDLMVDREQPAGYPDSLLVATPPYNSINQREVGTTFGLRAQDVIGWNPRSFRFLTSPDAFKESQKLFQVLGGTRHAMETPVMSSREGTAMQRQLNINQKSSTGQFRIEEARLTPGVSDAAKYAENWALASPRTPHKFEPAAGGKSTPLGELHWMRFSVTLWLPAGWKAPVELHAVQTACSE